MKVIIYKLHELGHNVPGCMWPWTHGGPY